MDDLGRGATPSRTGHAHRSLFDPDGPPGRIGHGELGGKARGLVLIREALRSQLDPAAFPGMTIDIPVMAVLCTDVFTTFIERNHLQEVAASDLPDDRIAHAFQKADLPIDVLGSLRALVGEVHTPLAVRSSSLLEDAEHEPFAGVYATKMIPNSQFDADIRFRQLVEAIKFVYASTFFKAARDYRLATGHADKDEKMAVIIQEMVGKRYHSRFYPECSGVARSYNYYPMSPARPENGVVNLALGLGKTIVDGGLSWTYSPAFPKIDPPFGSVEKLVKETQTKFWAVTMGEPPVVDPTREIEYMVHEDLAAAEKDGSLRYLASTFNPQSGRLSIGTGFKGPRALTFAPLLVLKELPVNAILQALLSISENALGGPVEIEFACTFNPNRFAFLQVRKMAVSNEAVDVPEEELHSPDLLVASRTVLGNGVLAGIRDIIYVRPDCFELKHTQAIVPELRQLNEKLLSAHRPYLLIALGRLGTTDPWLGIPIAWGQVSGAKAVIEAAQENVKVELSQGSHYFHNIINLGVKYFLIPFTSSFNVDGAWLDRQEVVEETRFIRHVRLGEPLLVRVDGRSSRGAIHKPREIENG